MLTGLCTLINKISYAVAVMYSNIENGSVIGNPLLNNDYKSGITTATSFIKIILTLKHYEKVFHTVVCNRSGCIHLPRTKHVGAKK